MNPTALRKLCEDFVRLGCRINLVVPGPAPRGERKRLAGRSGPLGDFLCQNDRGECVCSFDPAEIIRWLDKNNL